MFFLNNRYIFLMYDEKLNNYIIEIIHNINII